MRETTWRVWHKRCAEFVCLNCLFKIVLNTEHFARARLGDRPSSSPHDGCEVCTELRIIVGIIVGIIDQRHRSKLTTLMITP